jgi:hypothetical protein
MSLDLLHIPSITGNSDVQIFYGNSQAAGVSWQTWEKPRGKSMVNIQLFGKGGNGGLGVVGANSLAGGGGGGGSGSETSIIMPLALLPDQLYLSLAGVSQTTTLASYITVGVPVAITPWNNVLMIANGGGNGGNAAAGAGGALGAAGAIATVATMPLGWRYADLALAGVAGIVGGAAVAGGAYTLILTGQRLCGGTGGGGLPAAAAAGTAGGSYTITAPTTGLPAHNAPAGVATATIPPDNGNHGYQAIAGYFYGGTGGGSTHGTATGAGLVGSVGGNGAPGCGGGGNGGCLTGTPVHPAGDVGLGGPAFCIITCW